MSYEVSSVPLLKFITAGSVDDGKSTLIGRLLYEGGGVLDDQLEAIEAHRIRSEDGTINLALLTDGLKAEREQGITIDVAYKYFNTLKRKFIIIDAPGHVQYTRNMVTGASNADLAIILIDARKGVIEQTRRHSYLASLLRIPQLVVCVNKMDLVGYDEAVYKKIVGDYQKIAAHLSVDNILYLPASALRGDNITQNSPAMPWYKGPALLPHLEAVQIKSLNTKPAARFPVQYVIRPQTKEFHDYRGYAGKVIGGVFKVGDPVRVEPSGFEGVVKAIDTFEGEKKEALPGQSVTLRLDREIDISRGDLIAKADEPLTVSQDIEADICWMDTKAMPENGRYLLQHGSQVVRASVHRIRYKIDIETLEQKNMPVEKPSLALNDIGRIFLHLSKPLAFDLYSENRSTGAFILIDEGTLVTVGAGMIVGAVGPDDDPGI